MMRLILLSVLLATLAACQSQHPCPPSICGKTEEQWQAAMDDQDLTFDLDSDGRVAGSDFNIRMRVCK